MARILVTGSRYWANETRIREELLKQFVRFKPQSETILVNGGATGADSLAAHVWGKAGLPVETHYAEWDTHGKAAGPIRNQKMVDLGADVCLAFFKVGEENRGTTHCANAAAKAGIPVIEVWG